MRHLNLNLVTIASLSLVVSACGSSGSSYSMLASGQSFKQSTVNSKIDLLWVIDNSGSMQPLQNNMTANFNNFMSNFVSKGYDFHLGVTTTDAYRALPQFANDPTLAKFRDGVGATHSGVFTILPSTMDLTGTFLINASQGAAGSGDENAFSSFKAALDSPLNADFLRSNSFLAVVILSDEDDFSDPNRPEFSWTFSGGVADHSYSNPGLETVDSYVNYLDAKTVTTGAFRRYSVSALTVPDTACRNAHVGQSPSTIIGTRYMDMATKTSGVIGSVCDQSYASALTEIQKKIIELGTQFYLTGSPVVSSIAVVVNGTSIPQDSINGWTYNSAANSIVFHGGAIPPAGASIGVTFDPTSLTF